MGAQWLEAVLSIPEPPEGLDLLQPAVSAHQQNVATAPTSQAALTAFKRLYGLASPSQAASNASTNSIKRGVVVGGFRHGRKPTSPAPASSTPLTHSPQQIFSTSQPSRAYGLINISVS
jgi:hypothetical protein